METLEDVIRKKGKKYCVQSEKGKNLGCSTTKRGAHVRLGQVEFFKKKARKKK